MTNCHPARVVPPRSGIGVPSQPVDATHALNLSAGKLQCLTWPFVQLPGHFVQIGLRVCRQVGSLGEVLSEQAIGVLVGTALPRTAWVAEVNIDRMA